MRRFLCILICMTIIFGMKNGIVSAQNDTQSDESSSSEPQAGTSIANDTETGFNIDTENKYDGMNNTYKEGYIPAIVDNKAIIVLPLVPEGEIKDNRITAKLDYGTEDNIPFKHKNYEKIFGYDTTHHIYYVRFDLDLSKTRKNGTYPVNVTVNAKDKNSNKIAQTFTLYVLIEDGITEEQQTEPDTENATTKYLSIETNKKYSSMEQPYKNGYAPKIKNNRVKIILPLVSSEKLKNNKITAALDLGTAENTPFVYKNYEKDFQCGKAGVYCVEFTVNMQKKRYNGIYPITLNVSAKTQKGEEVTQAFTVYIAVTDGKNASEEGSDNSDGTSEPKPTSEPVVLVSSYEFDKAKLNSGDKFRVKIKLKNNSTTKSIQNMVVALDYDVEKFLCLDDTESIYISKLQKGATKEVEFNFLINPNTTEGNYKVGLNLSYDDSSANKMTSNGVVMVPVKQESKVKMSTPQISDSVYAGDTLPLDFQVMNLGRSTIYNVRCDIKGDGLLATSTAFIGNLEAGTEGNATMNLFISTKDKTPDSSQTEQYGETEGTITLTYEDAEGKEYTSESNFKTKILEPDVPQVNNDKQKTAGQWWISVLVIAVVIIFISIAVIIKKVNHKIKEEKEQNNNEKL